MRVCLTGAGGMLGHALQKVFSDTELLSLTHAQLNVTRLDDTVKTIKEARPHFLIHAGAFTNVDLCESEPEKAYLVNGLGTRNVVMACEEAGCPVLYISSDYVFDGTKDSPYNEWDETNPISVYGLSKLMGEKFVSSLTNRFFIVRTSWLYGPGGKNFVDTIAKLLTEKEGLQVVCDQIGSPTYTFDLAAKIRELLGRGYGTYHITNSGSCSWYEFAMAIAAKKEITKPITPVTSEEFSRPAKRPPYSVLGSTFLTLEGIAPTRHWQEALRDHLSVH